MRYLRQIVLLLLVPFMALPTSASAWNKPGHMLSGAIAFQVLEQENPETINKVKAILQDHPFRSTRMAKGARRPSSIGPRFNAIHARRKVGR